VHGHSKVVKILVEKGEDHFTVKVPKVGESAMSCACRSGDEEGFGGLFELCACVKGPFAGSEPLLEWSGTVAEARLLEVKTGSYVPRLATACGHAEVRGRRLRV
jgi:hypothetical protein